MSIFSFSLSGDEDEEMEDGLYIRLFILNPALW